MAAVTLILLLAQAPFELKDGDRVALVGNTFFEREIDESHIEAALTARWPDRNVIFRNLGWSGDTVWGHARAVFGKPEDGFAALEKSIAEVKPTVILVCYGMSESFEGDAGLAAFGQGLERMLDMLGKSGARMALISPIRHEDKGRPMPDPTAHNAALKKYTAVLAEAAKKRGAAFVNLFETFKVEGTTDNGIHLTPEGYRRAAEAILRGLGQTPSNPSEKMRRVIVAKNRLWFDRWRAANETYIFLFRKKEQGRNAVEIPQFDPFIAEKEAEIARLRKP